MVYKDPYRKIIKTAQNVNNFVKLNVNTWNFEEVKETEASIDVDGKQLILPGIVNVNETSAETPSVVRTILCASAQGATCDTMYLGGLFTHVYGTKAGGLAKIQKDPGNNSRTVTEILDTQDSGIIMGVSQYNAAGPLAVAGIFGPSQKDALEEDEPNVALDKSVQIVYPDGHVKCFISTDMLSMDQCRRKNAPENCCEKVVGPGHVIAHVASDEIVVGGSFSVSGTMKFEPANEPPAGGVPSENPRGGTNPGGGGGGTPPSSDDEELKSSNEPGYQNFQRLFVPRLTSAGRIDDDHAEEVRKKGKLTGGPNGEVMDIKCITKEDEYNNLTATTGWRCTELLVSGRFDTWEAFFWNDTTMAAEVNETATVSCHQGMAKLSYNNETTLYTPVGIHGTEER